MTVLFSSCLAVLPLPLFNLYYRYLFLLRRTSSSHGTLQQISRPIIKVIMGSFDLFLRLWSHQWSLDPILDDQHFDQ
jgi:hypothetical protein